MRSSSTSAREGDIPPCAVGDPHGAGLLLREIPTAWEELRLRCLGELETAGDVPRCYCGTPRVHLWEISWRDGPGVQTVADALSERAVVTEKVLEFARTRLSLPCGASVFLSRKLTMRRVAHAVMETSWTQEEWAAAFQAGDSPGLWQALQEQVTQEVALTSVEELAATLLLDAANVDAGAEMTSTGQVVAVMLAAAEVVDPRLLQERARQLLC